MKSRNIVRLLANESCLEHCGFASYIQNFEELCWRFGRWTIVIEGEVSYQQSYVYFYEEPENLEVLGYEIDAVLLSDNEKICLIKVED